MNKYPILYGFAGIVAGALLMYIGLTQTSIKKMQESDIGPTPTTVMHMSTGGSMTMDEMVTQLKTKTGDNFDKAYLEMMIEHHQGAIDMAKEGQKSYVHNEIKSLSDEVIASQEEEINQMRQWQKDWGYVKP